MKPYQSKTIGKIIGLSSVLFDIFYPANMAIWGPSGLEQGESIWAYNMGPILDPYIRLKFTYLICSKNTFKSKNHTSLM